MITVTFIQNLNKIQNNPERRQNKEQPPSHERWDKTTVRKSLLNIFIWNCGIK